MCVCVRVCACVCAYKMFKKIMDFTRTQHLNLLFSQEHDGADDLLNAERAHLLNSKKTLEGQLRLVHQQLQVWQPQTSCLVNQFMPS